MKNSKEWSQDDTRRIAKAIRGWLLKLTLERGGCYLSQACSSAEILAVLYARVLYFGESLGPMEPMKFPGVPGPHNPNYPKGSAYHGAPESDKDRFFVSPAHYATGVYAALVEIGRLLPNCIEKYNIDGWTMEMIGAEHSPGSENTAGSLSQTISVAGGTAHAYKMKNYSGKIYVLLSDGEIEEGQNWEAIQAMSFYKLDNVVIYVDVNGQQVEGWTKDETTMEPLDERFTSFGAKVVKVNGHNVEELEAASKTEHRDKPLVVLCYTSPSTGIPPLKPLAPFLHFVRPADPELKKALEDCYNRDYRDLIECRKEKEL
jgi:transketolase